MAFHPATNFYRILKKVFRLSLLFVLISAVVIFCGPWGMYLFGLRALLADSSPSREQIPEVVLHALWVPETNTSSMSMTPLSPCDAFRSLTNGSLEEIPTSYAIARYAARFLRMRNLAARFHGLSWHIEEIAIGIWISRNWTAEETLSTILAEGYFGHDFQGVEKASQGYFGLPVKNLLISEAVILAGLVRSPNYYDPWCHPRRAHVFAKNLLMKLNPAATLSIRLLPAPAGACSGNSEHTIDSIDSYEWAYCCFDFEGLRPGM